MSRLLLSNGKTISLDIEPTSALDWDPEEYSADDEGEHKRQLDIEDYEIEKASGGKSGNR